MVKKRSIIRTSLLLLAIFAIRTIISPSCAYALTEKTYYIHQDHLGSVIAVTDETGTLVSQTKYSPYGNTVVSNQLSVVSERKYTGQIKDQNTTLSYYNARYYDPVLSRFISPDTVADQQNRFAYVGGNPVMNNDPGGNQNIPCDPRYQSCMNAGLSYTPPNSKVNLDTSIRATFPSSGEWENDLGVLNPIAEKVPSTIAVASGVSCAFGFAPGCGVAASLVTAGVITEVGFGDTSFREYAGGAAGGYMAGQFMQAVGQQAQMTYQTSSVYAKGMYSSGTLTSGLNPSKSFNILRHLQNTEDVTIKTGQPIEYEGRHLLKRVISSAKGDVEKQFVAGKEPLEVARGIMSQATAGDLSENWASDSLWPQILAGKTNCMGACIAIKEFLGRQANIINLSNELMPHYAAEVGGSIVLPQGRTVSIDTLQRAIKMGFALGSQ